MSQQPPPRRGRVRRNGWERLGQGLHAPSGTDPLVAWQLVLPSSGVFTSVTAAAQRGWWLPPLPDEVPIFVACARADGRIRRPQVRSSRLRHPPEVDLVAECRLASAAETLLACARDLGLLDLVVLLDSALHEDPSVRSPAAELAGSGRPGARLLRRALDLADHRSESAWETLLRLLHVVCDVPVEPQREMYAVDGSFVARADLWLRETCTIHEYDGGEHRKAQRQARDLRRDRRLQRSGLVRHGYTSTDVIARAVTILADADAALGREHDPGRIRVWHELLRESAYTPAGLARLRRLWGLPPTVDADRSA